MLSKAYALNATPGTIPIPQQENQNDCGIYTLMYADLIQQSIPLTTLLPRDTPYFRKWIAVCIVEQEIIVTD
jgi:Ulp1 family protease